MLLAVLNINAYFLNIFFIFIFLDFCPSQGNTCLESGSYLMNYLGCAHCQQRDFVRINNKATEEEDGEEIVTYDRESPPSSQNHPDPLVLQRSTNKILSFPDVCKNCDHVIARHEYTFSVVDEYQVTSARGYKVLAKVTPTPCLTRFSPTAPLFISCYQEYTMLCMLCGKAEDSISVLPDDPRQSAPLF